MPGKNIFGVDNTIDIASDIQERVQQPIAGVSNQDIDPGTNYFTEESASNSLTESILKKPQEFGVDKWTDLDRNDSQVQLNDGTYRDKYPTYFAGTDNNERLAQSQGTGEKWMHGFEKLALKTGTAVLGGTLGVADSIVEGVAKGSLSEAYNTHFNKWLDDLNTELDYKLPNYYSEQESNKSLFGQLGTANFYADKVLGGVSFTLGAIVSEGIWAAATGGVGILAEAGPLGRLGKYTAEGLGGESKLLKVMNTAKAWAKGSSTSALESAAAGDTVGGAFVGKEFGIADNAIKGITEGQKTAAIRGYNLSKTANVALTALRSAGFESGMEARQYMQSTEAQWLTDYRKQNGHDPSADEYAQFKNGLENTGNIVFAANMFIVGSSNILQFHNSLLGKSVTNSVENGWAGRTFFGIGFDRTEDAAGKATLKALEATKAQRVAGRIWGVGKNVLLEGQEEMSQSVTANTAQNYMLAAYSKDKTKESYSGAQAFYDAVVKQYGTKQGLTEGLVGGMVGFLGAAVETRGKFNELSEERENVKHTVDYHNAFSTEMHINNIIANNKMNTAEEHKAAARSKNDVTGEVLADTASSIAHIERNYAIDNVGEGTADFTRQMNAVSNKELADQLGFGKGAEAEEKAEKFKQQKIQEYIELAASHTRNLQYAEALLGESNIAGLDALGDKIGKREVERAIAFNITMGQKALDINQKLVLQAKSLIAAGLSTDPGTDAMTVQQVLDMAPKEKVAELSGLALHQQSLDRQYKQLLKKQLEAEKLTDTEDNKLRTNTLIDINNQMQQVNSEIEKTTQQRQLAVDTLNVQNYAGSDITVDMLDRQQENIEKLKKTVESIKQSDPQKYATISKVLQEQSKAVTHAKLYDDTTRKIADRTLRVKLINGWLTKITNKHTKLNEGTAAHFADILKSWTEGTAATQQAATEIDNRKKFQNGEEVSAEYIKSLQAQKDKGNTLHPEDEQILTSTAPQESVIPAPKEAGVKQDIKDPIQNLEQKVKDILSGNDYLLQYFGQDPAELAKSHPEKQDMDRYQELLAKINPRVEPYISNILKRPVEFYAKKDLGLTPAEIKEFQDLNQKFNDWKTLSGAFSGDNSVASLLEMIANLKKETVKNQTKPSVEDSDFQSTIDVSETATNEYKSVSRGLQTATTALASVYKDRIIFNHIGIQTLQSFFPGAQLTLPGQTSPLTEADLAKISKKEGTVFNLEIGAETISVRVNDKAGLEVNKEKLLALLPGSNISIKDFGSTSKTPALQVYQQVEGTNNYIPVGSDFDYKSTNPEKNWTINQRAVNEAQNGDLLDLYVDLEDAYNAENIFSDSSTLTEQEKIDRLHVYAMKNGTLELMGSVPAGYKQEEEGVEIGKELNTMRRKIYKTVLREKDKGQQALIAVPQKMKVNMSFIGQPNVMVTKTGANKIGFTKEAIQQVQGTGYIQDGEITTNTTPDISQFIKAVSKKNPGKRIPFVVFNYEGKSVAFPVDLTQTTIDRSKDVADVLNSNSPVNDKANTLISTLLENGITAKDYKIDFTDPEWIHASETERALEDLSKVQVFADVEQFASKNYKKENLANDAQIAIDIANQPFASSKVMISPSDEVSASNVPFAEQRQYSEDERVELVSDLSSEGAELYKEFLSNPAFANVTDTHLSNTFDESPIEHSDIYLEQVRNIAILKEAFSKPVLGTARKVFGDEKIRKIKDMIDQYDKAVNQEAKVKVAIKGEKIANIYPADHNFDLVESIPYTEPEINKYKPSEQLKFNQGYNYAPVRIVGDSDLIELISIGSRISKGNPTGVQNRAALEEKFGMTAVEAFNRAKDIARKGRTATVENILLVGKPKAGLGAEVENILKPC